MWRSLLSQDLLKWQARILEHELESVDTRIVGFLAWKQPKATHLCRFTTYLKTKLPMTTPNFVLQLTYPKMVNGFKDTIKTEVVGIRTTKEHAEIVDAAFARLFLADTDGALCELPSGDR
jgi:hypothetical protein